MKNMVKKKITVFTPTYNRAYILSKLYDSLCRQTNKDFQWLIIDDGSVDKTEQLVKSWMAEGLVPISYYKKENGGKQRAHNYAVSKCETELFFCVDSDDYITDDCIEKVLDKWEDIKENERIAGIIAMRGTPEGKPLGTEFPSRLCYTTLSELYSKWKFKGDTALIYRTDVLKKYPFWVAEGEKFIGESYVWNQIDQNYKMAILASVVLICEYLEDGYTKNVRKLTKNNPRSYVVLKKQSINFSNTLIEKYIQTILCIVGCILCGKKKKIAEVPCKILGVFAYIPAWVAWFIFYKNA